MKYLFGLSNDVYMVDGSLEENMNYLKGITTFLNSKVKGDRNLISPIYCSALHKLADILSGI